MSISVICQLIRQSLLGHHNYRFYTDFYISRGKSIHRVQKDNRRVARDSGDKTEISHRNNTAEVGFLQLGKKLSQTE